MVGEYLVMDDDVEQCCAKLFRSKLFIQNSDTARYELIAIANDVCLCSSTKLTQGFDGQCKSVYRLLGVAPRWTDRAGDIAQDSQSEMCPSDCRCIMASFPRGF
jgi:hypothetical protein